MRTLTLALALLLLLPIPTAEADIPAPETHIPPMHKYTEVAPAKAAPTATPKATPTAAPSRAAEYRELVCEVTAYCNCRQCTGKNPGDPGYGITASGTMTQHGTIAADWSVFEPGTVIAVPGYGTGRVEDRGSAIRGMKLDLWFAEHEAALEWGRQKMRVRVRVRVIGGEEFDAI